MKIAHIIAGLSALTLAAAPVVGQATETRFARTASPVGESEDLGASSSLFIFLAFTAAVVAALVIVSEDDEDEDEPASP